MSRDGLLSKHADVCTALCSPVPLVMPLSVSGCRYHPGARKGVVFRTNGGGLRGTFEMVPLLAREGICYMESLPL